MGRVSIFIKVMTGNKPSVVDSLELFKSIICRDNWLDMLVIKSVLRELWYHICSENADNIKMEQNVMDAREWFLSKHFGHLTLRGKAKNTILQYMEECVHSIPDSNEVWYDNEIIFGSKQKK